MPRILRVIGLAAITALALSGCLREDATYKLQEDNTVDGNIILGVTQEELDNFDADSYKDFGLDASAVAAHYDHATVNDLGQDGWDGERITLVNEGVTSFSTAPTEAYEIKIDRVGDQYIVTGMDPDLLDESTKNAMINNGGSAKIKVTFPGKVLEHNGKKHGRTVTWDMTTEEDAPYARGMAIPPAPAPAPTEPEPATTEPEPAASPPVAAVPDTPSPSPAPSEPAATPVPADAPSSGIPPWVWIAIAVLAVAVAGLAGFMVASRGRTPAPAVKPEPAAKPDAEPESAEDDPKE